MLIYTHYPQALDLEPQLSFYGELQLTYRSPEGTHSEFVSGA